MANWPWMNLLPLFRSLKTRGYVQNVLTYDFYYQHLQDKEKLQTFSKEEYDRSILVALV